MFAKYIKAIFNNVVFPAIIDISILAVFVIFLYFGGIVIYKIFLSQLGFTINYIRIPTGLLGILYLFSIIIISIWRHLVLIRNEIVLPESEVAKLVNRDNGSKIEVIEPVKEDTAIEKLGSKQTDY